MTQTHDETQHSPEPQMSMRPHHRCPASPRCGYRRFARFMGVQVSLLLTFAVSNAAAQDRLEDARRGFETRLLETWREDVQLVEPPADEFTLIQYESPIGSMWAYLSIHTDIKPGEQRPAIVWLTGGFPAARGGKGIWTKGPIENDQSASAFRDEGVVMLIPTVRGTAGNPGDQEAFFGEVDDVLAAAAYLRSLPIVDPDRIILAGHSTGGTLALLVAESTDLFCAVVSYGPVARVADYGGQTWPFDTSNPEEIRLRSPLYFLESIRTPTLVVEGERANIEDLLMLEEANENPMVQFALLQDEDHFTPLAPVNRWLARSFMRGVDEEQRLDASVVHEVVRSFNREQREARDLSLLAELRADGVALGETVTLEFVCVFRTASRLETVRACFDTFTPGAVSEQVDANGRSYMQLRWRRKLPLVPEEIFNASAEFREACRSAWVQDLGWELVEDGH